MYQINDPNEALTKYLKEPPEPRFNAKEFMANMPPLTAAENLEAQRQFERSLETADLPAVILIINEEKRYFSDLDSKEQVDQVNNDDTAAINYVCDQILAGRISNEPEIIYVKRENGRFVGKLVAVPGFDGSEAYVLEEENEQAPPKTARKNAKSPSAQIKKTKLKNKTYTEIEQDKIDKNANISFEQALIDYVGSTECVFNYKLSIMERQREKVVEAWDEITKKMKVDFPGVHITKKQLMLKWTNLRDSWVKFNKKITHTKSGQAATNSQQYIHYNQMNFLKTVYDSTRTTSSISEDGSDAESEVERIVQHAAKDVESSSKKRRKTCATDETKFDTHLQSMKESAQRVASAIEKNNTSLLCPGCSVQKSPKKLASEQFMLSFAPALRSVEGERENMELRGRILAAFMHK